MPAVGEATSPGKEAGNLGEIAECSNNDLLCFRAWISKVILRLHNNW